VRINRRKKQILLRRSLSFVGQARLRNRSKPVLQQVAQVLKSNPDMRIRIVAITSHSSRRAWVKQLATQRALAVQQYISTQNIDPSRIEYRGYRRRHKAKGTKTIIRIHIQ
jgi:outer membrane protein OmpA-like peptidoglycan-associated protein